MRSKKFGTIRTDPKYYWLKNLLFVECKCFRHASKMPTLTYSWVSCV